MTKQESIFPLYRFELKCNGETFVKDVLAVNDETAIATILQYIGWTFSPDQTVTFTYTVH